MQDCDHSVIGALAVVADVNRCEFDTHGNNTTESPVMINMHRFVDSSVAELDHVIRRVVVM